MTKTQKELAAAFFVLLIVSIYSYVSFTKYEPKAVIQVNEVKGYATSDTNSLNLPYPEDAQQIAISNTKSSELITLHSQKTKEEVLNFYKNIMISKKWQVESENVYSDFAISRYYDEDKKITIITFDEPENKTTLTSIEILQSL